VAGYDGALGRKLVNQLGVAVVYDVVNVKLTRSRM
jgi:hypothetical protein